MAEWSYAEEGAEEDGEGDCPQRWWLLSWLLKNE